MTFEQIIKDIKKIYNISTNKDSEIFITYKGTSGGVTKPWIIRIDTKEANGADEKEAALSLFLIIKEELLQKISTLESQASSYREALRLMSHQEVN